MENQFPCFWKFKAMNTQSAKALSILFIIVTTATASNAFHLPVHHSNSTDGNGTDSADFPHRHGNDSHRGDSTQGYQYGRSSSNVYERAHDAQKEDYKNYTVHVVPPLANRRHVHDNIGNLKSTTEHQIIPMQTEAVINDTNQEEVDELSQHDLVMERKPFAQNQKTENKQDNNPAIAVYRNEIQEKETDTLTKLLSLEQRIAAYLVKHKKKYLPKDKKINQKKEVIVNEPAANMGLPDNSNENAKESLGDKNMHSTYSGPRTFGNKFKEDDKEIANINVFPKYNLYDDIGNDYTGADRAVKDSTGIDRVDEVRKDSNGNNNKNDTLAKNGKNRNIKDNNKVYDYYYDSERRQVSGSARSHYVYDDKGFVIDDTLDNKEDKRRSKDVLDERQGEKLQLEAEIFHETGSFHTVENFVEQNSRLKKQEQARWKPKPGSKNIGDDDEKVAMSAFKARVTRGEDEDVDKKLDDLRHPLIVDHNFGVNNSDYLSKNENHTIEVNSEDNKKEEIVQENNENLPAEDQLNSLDQGVQNDNSESLLQKDRPFHKQSNKNKSATLGLTSVHSEPTLPENDTNEAHKNERRYPHEEDRVKPLAKSEISKEPSMSRDHKALSGSDSIEDVDILFKYSTNSDHPITADAKHTGSKNITEEKLLLQSADSNKLDSGNLKTTVARSEAYLAVWASAASKNNTDTNMSSNFEARLETITENKEAYAGDNKTMPLVNQRLNIITQENKTGDSRLMRNFNESYGRKQNEQEIKDLKINTTLSNQEIQNTSKINQKNINQSNSSNNDTNVKDNTLGNSQNQVAENSTSSSNSSHNDKKVKVNVNNLIAPTEAVSSKLIVPEIVERASSSRKAVSQINAYQKVRDQVEPFDVSGAAMSSSNSRQPGTRDLQPAINTTSSRTKASGTSKLDKNNQPTNQIQNLNQEISGQINISLDANETNNSHMPNKVGSKNTNSSKEVTKFRDNEKIMTLYRDNLNSTSDNSHKLRESDFLKINASATQFPNDQTNSQLTSSIEIRKVYETDNKHQNNHNVTISLTDTQTNKFKVESLLASSNQSEARSMKQEPERRTVAPPKISANVFSTTKTQTSSKSTTATTSKTFKNNQHDGRKDALPISEKAEVTTKIADGTKEVNSSLLVSHKISVTNNPDYESRTKNVKEMKNDTFFNAPLNMNLTSLDVEDKNRTNRQQSDAINKVTYFTNGSNFQEETQMSNISMGLNVPRKLLSFVEMETHENSSSKIISAAHNVENNLSFTGESTNISGVGISKSNLVSSQNDKLIVKTGKVPSTSENNLKNGSRSFKGSINNPANKVTNLSDVHNGRPHGNATMVFLKLEAHAEQTRTEQNVSIHRKIENTDLTQNISNVQKNTERDPIVTITSTVKKNSSIPKNEKPTENATSNSFQKKIINLQPEVMANERHHQQKSQNQKLEPETLLKGDLADTVDLKLDANSNKDDRIGGIIDKEDSDKSKSGSFSNNSQNTGANNKASEGSGEDQDIGNQQPRSDQVNDKTKDNTKSENNDRKFQNKNDGISNPDDNSDVVKKDEQESGVGESDTITNSDVIKAQLDETSAKLEQEMSKTLNQKNSDSRSDNKLTKNDAKQIHNIDDVSASQKTTNLGKDVLQDVDSATRNNTKSPEADVESGFLQNDVDTSNDDVNDEVPKNEEAGNSNGLPVSSSTRSSLKIPEISPYKAQDFSLLKPGTAKAAASKDKNNIDQQKAKPLPGAAATNILRNSTTESVGNTSSSSRGECLDACSHEPGGAGIPQRAQAAVSAVLTTHFGPTKDQMIPFDLELLDLADNYDNTTGMFICTIPGTYVISLYLMSHPGAKVNARVLINNRPIAALWADDAKNAGFYPSSSTQTIAQLAFGDQVYVMLVDGGYGDSWVHANYNVFTIFLLYEQMF